MYSYIIYYINKWKYIDNFSSLVMCLQFGPINIDYIPNYNIHIVTVITSKVIHKSNFLGNKTVSHLIKVGYGVGNIWFMPNLHCKCFDHIN